MSLPPGVLLGNQTPRIRSVPDYDRTLGGEVVDFMVEVGRPLDPWQADIIMAAHALCDPLSTRAQVLWAAFELAVLLARQNGKGGVTEAIELAGLFLFKEPLIMHSAHQFKTSRAAFQRLIDIIDGSDWLTRRVQTVSRSKGEEGFTLTPKAGGGQLLFVARSERSGRGLTGSTTVFDEAAWLTIGQYAALTPALSTIPNPRIVYTSTPPDEDVGPMPEDAMLPSVRRRGHAGKGRIACFEWSPPKKFDRTDRKVWYDCNPAVGIRIEPWFLAQQLENFTEAGKPEKFDTEHLGAWPDDATAQWLVIAEEIWKALADPRSTMVDPVAFAIDVAPDRSAAAIGAAGLRADGLEHGEVIDERPGVNWVVERAVELDKRWKPCAVAVDDAGPAGSLITPLREAGVEVAVLGTKDVAQAYGQFYDACVDTRRFRHLGQDGLTKGVAGADTRELGQGRKAWDKLDSSVSITGLVAVTNARYTRFNPALHRQQTVVLEGSLMA